MFSVKFDKNQLTLELNKLKKNVGDKALVSTVNKLAAQGKTASGKKIRQEYAVTSADTRKSIKVVKAKPSNGIKAIVAKIIATGKASTNIIRFAEKKVTLAQARRRKKEGTQSDLRVRVRKAGGFKTIKGGFIATINRKALAFKRIPGTTAPGRKRYAGTKYANKIEPVRTIFIPAMFNSRKVNNAIKFVIRTKFEKIYENDVRFFMSKFNAAR